MKKISKIYISGLGAIGGAYGSRIFDTDPECITVIADSERITRYTKNGITINGKLYPFKYVTPEDGGDKADLILIAVKHHQLGQSIRDIEKYTGEDTVILSLLNGIVSEELVGRKYGMDKILHSFAVGTDAVREGTDIRFRNIGKIVFGTNDESRKEKVQAVKEFFERTGIPYDIPEDIIRELWWKFMLNVGINQVSAVLKAGYGIFQRVDDARELMVMASLEVVALAEKAGISLSKEDISKYIAVINTLSPEGKTSMLQDIEAGRKTEVEIFSGTVIEMGKKYGVETPVNDILFRMIRTLEQMNG
ncbi:MAG TPA: ketopantoate reductase family protein [Spirochaetota bacterium]|nr:ketopantoate reductase family protein [Spirochaetota bacterium]